jgi:hypothetical protein
MSQDEHHDDMPKTHIRKSQSPWIYHQSIDDLSLCNIPFWNGSSSFSSWTRQSTTIPLTAGLNSRMLKHHDCFVIHEIESEWHRN